MKQFVFEQGMDGRTETGKMSFIETLCSLKYPSHIPFMLKFFLHPAITVSYCSVIIVST